MRSVWVGQALGLTPLPEQAATWTRQALGGLYERDHAVSPEMSKALTQFAPRRQ